MAKNKKASPTRRAKVVTARATKNPKRKANRAPAVSISRRPRETKASTATEAAARLELQSDLPSFPVVGIGASAGGLEALSLLLGALPGNAGMAYIVVQHLAANHDSMLPELLGGATNLPVVQVTEGIKIVPDKVFVIPPNTQMGILDGMLHLLPRPGDKTQHMPIDFFLRSLADYAKSRAIGVILSGTASDGSLGLREIKGVGGIAMVQEPKSAKYDGMPRAAIATGVADMVLDPVEIARELVKIARHPFVRHARIPRPGDEIPLVEEHLRRIFFLLRSASGVDFTHYKQPTIKRRLQRRMVLHKISSIEHYLKLLQQNPAEVNALYQDLLIHVTRFFREPDTFVTLAEKVFPQILRNRDDAESIRVWVPGCSTGEEPYSIAIALLEYLGDRAGSVPIQIFATDISENAIDRARGGIYPESIAGDVSAERLRRFFTKVDGSYRIHKQVRDACIFARQDLTRDPPFSKLDLIVCRNVLIYLGPILQKKLMTVFHYALKPTGFLMLGGSETIGLHADLFALADKRHKLYTKKLTSGRISLDFAATGHSSSSGRAEAQRKRAGDSRTMGPGLNAEANRILLSRFAPSGVIIDSAGQIIQFRGQTGPFLEPAAGEASLNLLKMAREGLLYDLRKAINEARRTEHAVRRDGLHVKDGGKLIDVNIEVIPIVLPDEDRHFLILFERPDPSDGRASSQKAGAVASPPTVRKGRGAPPRDARGEKQMLRLQQELAASREYLQSIIQDLEAANEELQSANEEILSSNEELQSTNEELDTAKEELQSTNEELNTVNEELHGRNDELSRVNSDLINLLASVQIAIVMVASDLRIRRFTPMAEKVLNLIASDIGRPISDIKPNIDCPELEQLIAEAIDSVTVKECDVSDRQGNRYTMRIRPYKNLENKIDGAVVVLFNANAVPRTQTPGGETESNGDNA
jgi:two-component system CheB/CheR fusion protein